MDCKLCTEYRKTTGCAACGCPWLAERIEAGAIGCREAVMETLSGCFALLPRLHLLVRLFPGALRGEAHTRRMEGMQVRLGYLAYFFAHFITDRRYAMSCVIRLLIENVASSQSGYVWRLNVNR